MDSPQQAEAGCAEISCGVINRWSYPRKTSADDVQRESEESNLVSDENGNDCPAQEKTEIPIRSCFKKRQNAISFQLQL